MLDFLNAVLPYRERLVAETAEERERRLASDTSVAHAPLQEPVGGD